MGLHPVINLRLPDIAGFPNHPGGLLPAELLALALGFPGPLLLGQLFLADFRRPLPVQPLFFLSRPVHSLLELVDGGLDSAGRSAAGHSPRRR